MRFRTLLLASGLAVALPARATVAQQPVVTRGAPDPFMWLEDVDGQRSMDWVNRRNESTLAALGASPLWQPIFDRTKALLDSRDRIAFPDIKGEWIYNFWQDADHPRGLWRRTRWAAYLGAAPAWETVIDVDALAKAENVPWAWGGDNCLGPEERLCLIALSRGGSDANEVREFDTGSKRFVPGGFMLPEAKSSTAWIDANTLLVGTDFGAGSMTTSGYARQVKKWTRGTPLASATLVKEIPTTDMALFVGTREMGTRRYVQISHARSFFDGDVYIFSGGSASKVNIPGDADLHFVKDQAVVFVRTPWEVGGTKWETGSLIATSADALLRGTPAFTLVMRPGPREAIDGVSVTRDYLLLSMLDNVSGQLRRYRPGPNGWTSDVVPAPTLGAIGVSSTSPAGNRYFFTYQSFLQPTTLYVADEAGKVSEVKRLPAQFDATGLEVRQLEATSRDGTKIPFYVVGRAGLPADGGNPTLMTAYGGFKLSRTPAYISTVGANWLERGGTFVLANIRGGGEFGPAWHRAGLKENRQRIYDDFAAVAQELIRLRITSPDHLGIYGGSNGGLLMGVALTEHPELFNAIAIQNPLLDMKRYSHLLAGASWMGEYGDPDVPAEWDYISKYSPYQNLRPGQPYPKVLFTTTTRDDRVHPAHARKMSAMMEAMGYDSYYFENTEGGHGAGVTSDQRARTTTVMYTYFWQRLGRKPAS